MPSSSLLRSVGNHTINLVCGDVGPLLKLYFYDDGWILYMTVKLENLRAISESPAVGDLLPRLDQK